MAFKPAICSMSLGRAWVHNLPEKFKAAAAAGLPGIEIFYEDLIYHSSTFPGGSIPANQLLAASQLKSLCSSLNLTIIALGPFIHCEGLLDPFHKRQKQSELHHWFSLARILDTDLIQIPSTYLPSSLLSRDLDIIASNLREIADTGAAQNPPFRFAYENLCWGTHVDTWSKAWVVVQKVDRSNFGLCLDTFNVAGREFADPESENGIIANSESNFAESTARLAKEVDVKKVFYVQIVDAERAGGVLDENHAFWVEGQKPGMSWSRNCRLFLCEEEKGGYLPVMQVLRAICGRKEDGGLGYEGWLRMELFNRSLVDERESVPMEHAVRAVESWRKVVGKMGWEGIADEVEERKKMTKGMVDGLFERVEISARL